MGIASRMTEENRVPELKNRTISMAGRNGLIDLGASLPERVIEISCFILPKRTAAFKAEGVAYFSRTMAKITPENYSSERIKSITVRVCISNCTGEFYITDLLLQGGGELI